MEIVTRESQLSAKIDYKDGCTKIIQIQKVYTDNTKTPVFRYKTVRFRNPDGTINYNKSYDCRLIIDKSDESGTEYIFREVEFLITFNYNDNSTKTINTHRVYMNRIKKHPLPESRIIEFTYPDGTIDGNRSTYEIERTFDDKIGESDFEDESPDIK